MVKKIFITLAVVFVLSTAAHGQEQFRTEISGIYNRADWEERDGRTITYGLAGEWFFDPVKTADHPYSEAAFLERSGSVLVRAQNQEVKLPSLGLTEPFPITGKGPNAGIRITYAKKDFPLVVQLRYDGWRIDLSDVKRTQLKGDSYGISIGDYVMSGLVVGIDYAYIKSVDWDIPPNVFPYRYVETILISPFVHRKTIDYGLFARYVHEMEYGRGVTVEARVGQARPEHDGTKNSTSETLSIMYYFIRSMGVGIGIKNTHGTETIKGKNYQAKIDYFIVPPFSIRASYDRFVALRPENYLENYRSFNVLASIRF